MQLQNKNLGNYSLSLEKKFAFSLDYEHLYRWSRVLLIYHQRLAWDLAHSRHKTGFCRMTVGCAEACINLAAVQFRKSRQHPCKAENSDAEAEHSRGQRPTRLRII